MAAAAMERPPSYANGDGAAHDLPPPLLVQVLGGNVVTSAVVLACLNTVDATALRRLHPALAAAVAAVPWADTKTYVRDLVRWRAALPAATALLTGTKFIHPFPSRRDREPAALGGVTVLEYRGASTGDILHLPSTLRTLNVMRSGLEHASFTHLTALETLDCSETFALTAGLSRLPPSLRELHMNNCCLPDTADFSHLRQLRVMCSRNQGLSSAAVASLPPSLEVLDISCRFLFNDYTSWPRGWSLAHLTGLRELLASCTKIDAAAIASLPPSLRMLDLANCERLSFTPAFSLAHLTCLQTLNLTDTRISSATLASLPPSLVSLNLHGRYAKILTVTTVFPDLPALRVLNVSCSRLGDAAVASMPAGLEELHMVCCCNITQGASLDHLAVLRVLQSAGTNLSGATIAACRARGCFAPIDGKLELEGAQVNLLVSLPDGRLVSSTYGGCVKLWELPAGRGAAVPVAELDLRRYYLSALAVLHDGHRVAIGVGGNTAIVPGGIVVWDTSKAPPGTRVIAYPITVCTSDVLALAVAHNGKLVAGCHDGKLRVVDVDGGDAVTTMAAHPSPVTLLAALLGGKVASATENGKELKLWDVGTGTCVSTRMECTSSIRALAALPDGRLASGSWDGTVRLWDAGSGTCIRMLTDHTESISALTVLPGNRLASVSGDNTIRVWDMCDDAGGAGGSLARPPLVIEYQYVSDHMAAHTPKALVPLPGNRLAAGGYCGVHLWQLPPPRST